MEWLQVNVANGSLIDHEDNLEHSAVALYEELAWTHGGWERLCQPAQLPAGGIQWTDMPQEREELGRRGRKSIGGQFTNRLFMRLANKKGFVTITRHLSSDVAHSHLYSPHTSIHLMNCTLLLSCLSMWSLHTL